jgi:DNA topoisomerase III
VKLYITEKPSVAKAIANLLPGQAQYRDGHYEVGDVLVVPLQGHVLEQAQPHEYEARYKDWRLEDLPIAPKVWKKNVRDEFKARVGFIGKALKRASVVVHAGDPDREGQLIVDEVLEHLDYRGRVLRILPNSIEDVDLRGILKDERDNRDFAPLTLAAKGRERKDFLYGISPTRGITLIARSQGYQDMVFTVGRVQTPTLGLVVRREREIQNFVPVDHFTVEAHFQHVGGVFSAAWKPKDGTPGMDEEKRLLDRTVAEAVAAKIAGKTGRVVSFKDELKKMAPPLPFSLNSLQKEAGAQFKMPITQVKEIAQKLYDKPFTLTTYPRSDSKYLPLAQHAIAGEVLAAIAATSSVLAPIVAGADASRKSAAFKDTKDPHHAIVPTREHGDASALGEAERKIYELIARTYIAQFYPPLEYRAIEAVIDVEGEIFVAKGRIPVAPGWRAALPKKSEAKEDDEQQIARMREGDAADCVAQKVCDKKTQPPPRFTQASLVDAMEHIDKFVTDPQIKARLKAVKGIGTSATQDTIIDGLLKRGYLGESEQKLVPNPPAFALIGVLEAVVPALVDPGLTALMEQNLEAVAEGRLSLEEHEARDVAFVTKVIAQLKEAKFPPASAFPMPRGKTRAGKGRKRSGGGAKAKGQRKWQPGKKKAS